MSQYFYWWWTALEELPGENTKEIFQDEKHEDFHKLFSLQSGIGRYCHPSHGWVWLKLFTSCKGKNFNILFDLLMCPFREHETNGKVLYFKGRFPIIQHLVILKRHRKWNYLNPTGSVVSVSPSPFKVEILNYVKSVIFPNTKLGNKSFLMWTRIAFQYFWVSLFAQAMIKSHNTNIKDISDKTATETLLWSPAPLGLSSENSGFQGHLEQSMWFWLCLLSAPDGFADSRSSLTTFFYRKV